MSKLDIIETEIARRTASSGQLKEAEADLLKAKEQFYKLDEMYRSDEKNSRDTLECLYKERRHFSGKWPKVYSFVNTEYYPFFNGATDNDCNPYFPISKIKDKTFDGISPLYVAPTGGAGVWARDRNYTGSLEPALRTSALNLLSAFPDISGEVASCSNSSFSTPATCSANGGTWGYDTGTTATEKIRPALIAWKTKVENDLIPDICDTSGTQLNFWQNILSKINIILSATTTHVSYPNHTVDFAPGSPADIARDYLLSGIDSDITNRINYLSSETDKEEKIFFGIMKLRFNQANGSFSKKKAIDYQIQTNRALIKDNTDAIASLNILKVKNS